MEGIPAMKYLPDLLEYVGLFAILAGLYLLSPILALIAGGGFCILKAELLHRGRPE